jgi:uncharacterized membrane protein
MNPLAMVAMKDKLKGVITTKSSNSNSNCNSNYNNNLEKSHDKLIIDIIQGEKKVVENKPRNTIISLEEAANKIKNSR